MRREFRVKALVEPSPKMACPAMGRASLRQFLAEPYPGTQPAEPPTEWVSMVQAPPPVSQSGRSARCGVSPPEQSLTLRKYLEFKEMLRRPPGRGEGTLPEPSAGQAAAETAPAAPHELLR